MSVDAWPFLIGRSRSQGYQAVVAPDFMVDGGTVEDLEYAPDGVNSEDPSVTIVRELTVHGQALSIAYHRSNPRKSSYGIKGIGRLNDRVGRPIQVIEGIVINDRAENARSWQLTEGDFRYARRAVSTAYRRFWRTDTSQATVPSKPFKTGRGGDRSPLVQLEIHRSLQPTLQPSCKHRFVERYRELPHGVKISINTAVLVIFAVAISWLMWPKSAPAPNSKTYGLTPSSTLYDFCVQLRNRHLEKAFRLATTDAWHHESQAAFAASLPASINSCTASGTAIIKTSANSIVVVIGVNPNHSEHRISLRFTTTLTKTPHGNWLISNITPELSVPNLRRGHPVQ